ncbi:MAG: hypothetical protein ABIY50_11640 [Ignavibacteria bacterium]
METEIAIDPNISDYEIPLTEDKNIIPISPANFNDYSYSKKTHFDVFKHNGYDKLFYGEEIGTEGFYIKTYQNLLVFSFITQNIPEGSRVLEIGNGDDYIKNHFQYLYEFWRIEDASNLINDAEVISNNQVNMLQDNKGNYHSEIPKGHFDFVFSTTGFYSISDDESLFKITLDNIDKMVKPGGYSLQCFPAVIVQEKYFYYHPFLSYMNNNIAPVFKNVQRFIRFPVTAKMIGDNDLHFVYEPFPWAEDARTEPSLNTVSYNFLWRKKMLEMPEVTRSDIKNYYSKYPSFIFHHILKCGGTSVKEVLQNWFHTEYDYVEESENKNHFLKFKLNIKNINADTCVSGHFQYEGIYLEQRYPEILDDAENFKLFTFVRDPLQIRISLYYYNKNNLGIENMSLANALKYFSINFLATLFNCNESNYKQILDRYFFIGIVEKMQESFDKLAVLLNRRKITLPVTNTSQKDSQISGLGSDFIENFKKENKLDYLIYEYCLEKFNKI